MSQNYQLWPVFTNNSTGARVNAVKITAIFQQTDGSATATVTGGFDDVPLGNGFMGLWNPVVGGWLVFGNGSLIYFSNAAFTAQFSAQSAGTVTSVDITDSTAVGRSVLTAADAAAARTAIGAGTSNLALGTTGTTALAGNGNAATASSAAQWTTPRTLTLSGACTGNASISGAANISITTALSAPTASVHGGIFLGAAVPNTADATTVVASFNALLASLRTAQVIAP